MAVKGSMHTFEAIRDWLVLRIAGELGIAQQAVKADEEFTNLGLGSRQAIMVTGELEDFLGAGELDPALLWDYPTINQLARHLAVHYEHP
jgi:acyl carrier protein